ncbi:hypothetical protein FACS1894142_6530 [Spirochaetia bacterium]|nr:hypothetical protein FACS1894142_6530 [Spirochaetia bacterium]
MDLTPRRTKYRIDAEQRYAEVLTNSREFFAAEEQLIKGIDIYTDAVARRVISTSPEAARLYADLGDLEFFVKSGDMGTALDYYNRAERDGWSPPEMKYRMGAAYYQLGQWNQAQERFFTVSGEIPLNRRLLQALGNVSYMQHNYFAAEGYYQRLFEMLDADRAHFPMLVPDEREDHLELAERLMIVRNNMAVNLEALSDRTGDTKYRSRALGHYAESERAWDLLTRDPDTMIRAGAENFASPGVNLAYLNSRNTLYPVPGYEPQIYVQIDRDVPEPSDWERLLSSR